MNSDRRRECFGKRARVLLAALLVVGMPPFAMAAEGEPVVAGPSVEQPAAGAPALKAKRWTERTDKKTGKRLLTVWVRNEGMRDFEGRLVVTVRGKSVNEVQRTGVEAKVPVYQERAVEVEILTQLPLTGEAAKQAGGFGAAGIDGVQKVVSVEVGAVSPAVEGKSGP